MAQMDNHKSRLRKCRQWPPRGRTLHLVDIENIVGVDPRVATRGDYIDSARAYDQASNRALGDHLVVGCNPVNFLNASAAFPGSQLLGYYGPDGGERAIIESVNAAFVCRAYFRVVIGSGDHAFAPIAAELLKRGLSVETVSRPDSYARDMRVVAGQPTYLPRPRQGGGLRFTHGQRNESNVRPYDDRANTKRDRRPRP